MSEDLQVDYIFTQDGGYDVRCRRFADAHFENAALSDVRVIIRHNSSDERVSDVLTHLLADINDNGLQMIYQRAMSGYDKPDTARDDPEAF